MTRVHHFAISSISFLAMLLFLSTGVVEANARAVPTTHMWNLTGSLNGTRAFHTATLLTNGQILVVGGIDSTNTLLASAELYDPGTGVWTPTGSLHTARYEDTATLLSNGEVLVAGGQDTNEHALSSAEVYDLATGTWSLTGNMNVGRAGHTATLLSDGEVLVAGGLIIRTSPSHRQSCIIPRRVPGASPGA